MKNKIKDWFIKMLGKRWFYDLCIVQTIILAFAVAFLVLKSIIDFACTICIDDTTDEIKTEQIIIEDK